MAFIDEIKARAKADKKTIVLPETEDVRTYQAAEAVLREGTADLILVGSKEEIEKNGAGFDLTGAVIVDPATSDKTESYIAKLVELRQKKGMTEEQAREILLNKISIRILCNGSAGLRYGCRRYIYFWRFRTGAESGS